MRPFIRRFPSLARPVRCGAAAARRCLRVPAAIALCATLALAANVGLASPRQWQPLLLRGVQLPQLLNTPVDRIEVLAIHGGKLEPIPFQVDSVLMGGLFGLPQGPAPTTYVLPQAVGPEDEMSMMMFDLGERLANPAEMPPRAVEVAVADPLGGSERYAYIGVVKNPRRSPVHYVDYDPQRKIIDTGNYRLGFKGEFPDEFRVQEGKGELSRNLISGFELSGKVTVLNMIDIHLAERDVDSRLLAYRVGPVRLIRRVAHRIRIFKRIHSPEVSTVEFFYRDFAQAPFTMRLPLRTLFHDIQGRIAMDFVDLRGYALMASGLAKPVEIGDDTPAEVGDATPAAWLALRGDGRVMLETFASSDDLSLISRHLYYHAHAPSADGTEQSAALAATVGIETDGWQRLSAGPHRFNPMLISVPESYGADRAIAEAMTPPVVTVRAIAERNMAPSAARSGATVTTAPLSELGK
jgi:hypothetical protein